MAELFPLGFLETRFPRRLFEPFDRVTFHFEMMCDIGWAGSVHYQLMIGYRIRGSQLWGTRVQTPGLEQSNVDLAKWPKEETH